MDTRGFSAYNLARGVLLNSKLTVADSGNHPLKLLDIVISGMGMDATAGLWLTPLHAIPAVPRVFPFDLIYLDKEYRVLETVEMGPGIEFPRFHAEVASALVLPPDTLRRTHTEVADRLVVCISSELEKLLAASGAISPDLAPPNRESISAMSARSAADEHGNPSTIELTPVTPAAAAVTSHRAGFEHTILTAVARVAETRETVGPSAASERVELSQDPSIGVTDAVLKPSRKVEPAIIEHHIDPEDLFSNWVVTAPPVPAHSSSRRAGPPEPPEPAKTEKAFQDGAPEPVKQNGRKPATIKPPIEDPFPPHAAAGNGASKAQAKTKPVAAAAEKAALPAKSRTVGSAKPNPPVIQSAASQVSPATTFTTAPYGMWQVSMPTAVAPMFGAKSPAAPKAPTSLNSSGGTKQAKVASPPAPETQAASPTPRSATQAAADARPVPASITPKPQARPESAPVEPAAKEEAAAPKPMVRAQASGGIHVPGDFVASLQKKLQRAQQSKPATTPVAAVVPSQPASAPPPLPPPPLTSSSTMGAPAEPGLRSKPAASSVPAKPKADPSASTLRSKFKHWLNPASSPSDRRRNSRRYVPGMVAHYFTGGAPKPHDVADISMTGMYLLTDDRWMPGTMIQMTLQKPCAQGEKKQSINVLSRIVRRGSDGVAAEFVMSEALSRISHDIQPSQATDKFALARFI
jgi:hypothetical protein